MGPCHTAQWVIHLSKWAWHCGIGQLHFDHLENSGRSKIHTC